VVGFRESIFVYSTTWLREFGELYRREIGVPYYCHLRADMMSEEMVELLAWSGCHTVNVGIETASPRLANDVLKRHVRFERLCEGIRMLKRAGIVVFADNILGIPGGTLEDDLATLKLNIELDVDYAASTLCTPYPGTGIADYAIEHGYFDGDYDVIEQSYYTESCLRFSSAREKRRTENLHKLFAITAAFPALLPLVERLIDLPPNDFFYSAFRAWYVVQHMTDVMPRRPNRDQLVETILSVFGVYRGNDPNRYEAPAAEPLPFVDVPPQRTVALGKKIALPVATPESPKQMEELAHGV
jgi:hypothetical protein